MTVTLRAFKESDLSHLFEMLKEPGGEQRLLYMHYGDGNLLSWIHERKLEVLVAENNCRIIGSVAYNNGFWGAEIEWLVVCQTAESKLVEDLSGKLRSL